MVFYLGFKVLDIGFLTDLYEGHYRTVRLIVSLAVKEFRIQYHFRIIKYTTVEILDDTCNDELLLTVYEFCTDNFLHSVSTCETFCDQSVFCCVEFVDASCYELSFKDIEEVLVKHKHTLI